MGEPSARPRPAAPWPCALVRQDGEAGRPPRALAQARDALRLQPGQDLAHGRAREAAVLGRREIVADPSLDLADRRTDGAEIRCGDARQQLHQHQTAQPAREFLRVGRQATESMVLAGAVQSLVRRVEDQEEAPVFGKVEPRDQRRRQAVLASAAVEDEAALLEGADSDTRAAATLQELGNLTRRHRRSRPAWRAATPSAKASWVPGPQPRMGRDGLLDDHAQRRQVPGSGQTVEHGARAFHLRRSPLDREIVRWRHQQLASTALNVSPRLPKRRPSPPSRSRKPRCRRAGARTRTCVGCAEGPGLQRLTPADGTRPRADARPDRGRRLRSNSDGNAAADRARHCRCRQWPGPRRGKRRHRPTPGLKGDMLAIGCPGGSGTRGADPEAGLGPLPCHSPQRHIPAYR